MDVLYILSIQKQTIFTIALSKIDNGKISCKQLEENLHNRMTISIKEFCDKDVMIILLQLTKVLKNNIVIK